MRDLPARSRAVACGVVVSGCPGHGGLPAEFRTLLLGALDRIEPALERLRAAGEGPVPDERPCEVCPICALIAAWRGERSELAVRAADHAAGLVAVLRAALDEGCGGPAPTDDGPPPGGRPGRPVQHIGVHRGPR